MLCRHCNDCKVCRPRGLCWSCYYRPGVRDMYPSTSIHARRGIGAGNLNAPLPEPTLELPGSEGKIAVLAERAKNGLALHHPDDVFDAHYQSTDLRKVGHHRPKGKKL